jgi:hypothetical protein
MLHRRFCALYGISDSIILLIKRSFYDLADYAVFAFGIDKSLTVCAKQSYNNATNKAVLQIQAI